MPYPLGTGSFSHLPTSPPPHLPVPSSKQLITFYNHLAKTLDAGLSLPAALESAPGLPAGVADDLARGLYAGGETASAFEKANAHLPTFDLALLKAAARTARMPETFRTLVEHHELKVQTTRAVIGMLVYPLILLHLAAFAFPILGMVDLEAGGLDASPADYAEDVLAALGAIWAALAFGWALFSADAPAAMRIKAVIPGVRGYQKNQALSRFSFALGSLLDAGFHAATAWRKAGALSADPALVRAASEIADAIDSGRRPGELLGQYAVFPRDFLAFYQTGEQTGSLVETLQRQGGLLAERARDSLGALKKWLPALILIAIISLIGFRVVTFYAAYFKQIEDLL